jgi:hypothetical protein
LNAQSANENLEFPTMPLEKRLSVHAANLCGFHMLNLSLLKTAPPFPPEICSIFRTNAIAVAR